MREIVRYDRNIVSGIVHATKEYGITDVIIGMHCKNCAGDTLFGNLTGALLEDLYQEVMIARFLMPVNTLRRIIVTVPAKAEYEPGFLKWVEQICRLATALGGGVYFYAGKDTNTALQKWIRENYKQVTPFFEDMDGYEDLPEISPKVNSDHLLIIVAARQGTVSYDEQSNELKLNIPFIVKNVAIFYGDEDCEGEIRVVNADGLTLNLESFSEDEIQFVFGKKPSAKEYNIKFQYVVIVGEREA